MTSTEVIKPSDAAAEPNNKLALLPSVPAMVNASPPPMHQQATSPPFYGTLIPNRIFVGGISHDTTESDLLYAFSSYGKVRSTKIIFDNDGYNKGYGFVTFDTEEEARRLQSIGRCVILRNRMLNIAPAFKKQQIRPKFQQIVDTNGTVYFPSRPQPAAIGNMPINPYAAAAGTCMPAIYPQTAPGLPYQPIYQYYSVPVNVPTFWPPNYYGNSQAPPQAPQAGTVLQQGCNVGGAAWECDGSNNNSWHSN